MLKVGDTFERRARWSEAEIAAFAALTGDTNPLHHDAAFAATTRFGGIIASGAQSVAFLTALCGAQATLQNPGLGLAFNFTLRGAARANEDLLFRWGIVAVSDSEKPRGTRVDLSGALGEGGRTIVTATGSILCVARL